MMRIVSVFIFLCAVNACSDAKQKAPYDIGIRQDGGVQDLGRDSSSLVDAAKDSSDKDLFDAGAKVGMVVPGERCIPSERIGTVVVEKFQKVQVNARLFDRPIPSIADPVLSDDACSFYEFIPSQTCKTCSNAQTCDQNSMCVDLPKTFPNASLKISDGMFELNLNADEFGDISGQIEAAGDTFSIELTVGSHVLNLPATTIPAPLEGLVSNLSGSYENPDAMDFSWDLPTDPARVFTHVPINHHSAVDGTFTECEVDATRKSLHIDGPMLKPLAVVTGLEFQTINHVRFAAAKIKEGCIEFRFQSATFP